MPELDSPDMVEVLMSLIDANTDTCLEYRFLFQLCFVIAVATAGAAVVAAAYA